MRITFVISTIERGGGAEKVCAFLAGALQERGYRVSIQLLMKSNKLNYPVKDGVNILPPPCFRFGIYGAIVHFLIRCFLHRNFPDCVISFLEPANVFAAILARFTGVRTILTERANPKIGPRDPRCIKRIRDNLSRIAKYVMQTERCAEKFHEYLPVKPEQLVVIYNPVESHFSPDNSREGSNILLAVGRLYYQKGYNRMLRIFAAIHPLFPEKKLIICGSGPEEWRLKALAKKYSIEDSVFFPGNVKDPGEYCRKAEVFLMTSHYEGMPNAMLEAYANGCPAISFDFDFGASDIIKNEINGLLIPQDDEKAFEKALIRYLKDPGLRDKFVRNIPQTLKKFSPEAIVTQWEQVIHG